MGSLAPRERKKSDKGRLSKNKTIKLYREKQSKIQLLKNEVSELTKKYEEFDSNTVEKFDDFPLSSRTKKGLQKSFYTTPTEIQKDSIGLALKGHDVLGASKTGSGKTLAFIVPILENLFCNGWSAWDGLGALVITPTRELAYQIFDVLNKVGAYHSFSAGLVIGGKDIAAERVSVHKCNIVISTPGRLLQHFDENPLFNADNLKVLVLDEADHILSLGFQESLTAIMDHLPIERQTLLFSATQTKSVKDLARLSLKNPVYVSVHEHAKHITPEGLEQSYIVCEAHDKMNMMWSFLKSHKRQKILVFMATCKQVKYIFESFCRMRPGVSVMSLYGSLSQPRRMNIYDEFRKKNHAVMFATDIAARGLDFPNVNWVVQLDCAEDVNTYIHRVGRTARYQKGGEALLVLLPSEKDSMIEQLNKRKIPVEEIKVNPRKLQSIQRKLEAICARDVNLKESGKRACKAYLKNLCIMKDKTVFDVFRVDQELYAKSLGLAVAPRVRFVERRQKMLENAEKLPVISDKPNLLGNNSSDNESEDDLLVPKESTHTFSDEEDVVSSTEETKISKKPLTKAALAKRILKKNIKPNLLTKYDEEGKPIREICGQIVPVVAEDIRKELMEEGYSIAKAKLLKQKEDEVDKVLYKNVIKSKHQNEKFKLKKKTFEDRPENEAVTLNDNNEEQNDSSDEDDDAGCASSEGDIDPNNMSCSEESDEEESDSDASEESENKYEVKKRVNDYSPKSSKKRRVEDQPVKKERTIEDDEQLAMHFLMNT